MKAFLQTVLCFQGYLYKWLHYDRLQPGCNMLLTVNCGVYLWWWMLSDRQVQAGLWKSQRPDVDLPSWSLVSPDSKRSGLAFRDIWLGKTLPDDLLLCEVYQEIWALLLRHSKKNWTGEACECKIRSILNVITQFTADWGHRRIPSVSLCIIAFPLPSPSHFCIIQDHPSHSSQMSPCCCLLRSELQTCFGDYGWS